MEEGSMPAEGKGCHPDPCDQPVMCLKYVQQAGAQDGRMLGNPGPGFYREFTANRPDMEKKMEERKSQLDKREDKKEGWAGSTNLAPL